MTKFRKWLLEKITKDVVIQGNHKQKIIDFYYVLVKAARNEFTEDNKPTLDDFLQECLKEALDRVETKEKSYEMP